MYYYDSINGHVVYNSHSPELDDSDMLKALVIDEEVKMCKNCLMMGSKLNKKECKYKELSPYFEKIDELTVKANKLEQKVK